MTSIYLAGPLFSDGERTYLDELARRLRARGHEVFVPHEQFRADIVELDAATVFRVDLGGVRSANVLVAWLDGPAVDDGTACEIGIFSELVAAGDARYLGVVGLVTDLRSQRRRGTPGDGINLFVAGAVLANGALTWSIEEMLDAVDGLADGSRTVPGALS